MSQALPQIISHVDFLLVAFHWLLFGTEEIQLFSYPVTVGNLCACAQPLFSTLL